MTRQRSQYGATYALAYSSLVRQGWRLASPIDGKLQRSETYHFQLPDPDAVELVPDNDGGRTSISAVSPGVFEFDHTPVAAGTLDVRELPARSSTWWTILRYEGTP